MSYKVLIIVSYSDPDHPRYGEHLSKEEVKELVSPHPVSVDTIQRWFIDHGFDKEELIVPPTRDGLKVVVPVSKAEQMLNTVSRHSSSAG